MVTLIPAKLKKAMLTIVPEIIKNIFYSFRQRQFIIYDLKTCIKLTNKVVKISTLKKMLSTNTVDF